MKNNETIKIKNSSSIVDFYKRLTRDWSSKVGLILFAFIILSCLVGPLLSPYGVNEIDLSKISAKPNTQNWFGCDMMGRDLLTRLLYGGRISLLIGIIAVVSSALIGIILGLTAGYFGKSLDNIIMRFLDVWSSLPAMLLCIIISALLGAGFMPTIIALSVGRIPSTARMIRGQTLVEGSKEYIEAAESINCPKIILLLRHLLPNTIQPVIIISTMAMGATISMAASLSYIGLGVQPPIPEWGALLADGRAYIRVFPHMIMFPGIAIALTVLALNLIGDGLRDALDPKLRD